MYTIIVHTLYNFGKQALSHLSIYFHPEQPIGSFVPSICVFIFRELKLITQVSGPFWSFVLEKCNALRVFSYGSYEAILPGFSQDDNLQKGTFHTNQINYHSYKNTYRSDPSDMLCLLKCIKKYYCYHNMLRKVIFLTCS